MPCFFVFAGVLRSAERRCVFLEPQRETWKGASRTVRASLMEMCFVEIFRYGALDSYTCSMKMLRYPTALPLDAVSHASLLGVFFFVLLGQDPAIHLVEGTVEGLDRHVLMAPHRRTRQVASHKRHPRAVHVSTCPREGVNIPEVCARHTPPCKKWSGLALLWVPSATSYCVDGRPT